MLTSKKKADFLSPLKEVLNKKAELPKLVLHLRNKVSACTYNLQLNSLNQNLVNQNLRK